VRVGQHVETGDKIGELGAQESLENGGYSFVTTRQQLLDLPPTTEKAWGTFSCNALYGDLDRVFFNPQEPSLVECTSKAIGLLSRNTTGFFLMVEGSEVDWGSHANDPVKVVSDYLAFDSAVAAAVDFARTDGSTEVLVFSDHDNGGMSLGARGDDYTSVSPGHVTGAIRRCSMTCTEFPDTLIRYKNANGPVDWSIIADRFRALMGIDSLTPEDMLYTIPESVNAGAANYEDIAKVGAILSRRCSIGWTTNGHTGNNVPIYSLLTPGLGTIDNTDIARYCAHLLGVDLRQTGNEFFVALNGLFSDVEASVTLNTTGVTDGKGFATIQTANTTVTLPFFKDFCTTADGRTVALPGITVYSQLNNTVYVAAATKDLITGVRIPLPFRVTYRDFTFSERDPATVTVFTITGRQIKTVRLTSGTTATIDFPSITSTLPAGCYTLRVTSHGTSHVNRFSIVR